MRLGRNICLTFAGLAILVVAAYAVPARRRVASSRQLPYAAERALAGGPGPVRLPVPDVNGVGPVAKQTAVRVAVGCVRRLVFEVAAIRPVPFSRLEVAVVEKAVVAAVLAARLRAVSRPPSLNNVARLRLPAAARLVQTCVDVPATRRRAVQLVLGP